MLKFHLRTVPSYSLNPDAPPFPQHSPQRMILQFLLKKDFLLSRFTNYNDQPESYAVWKASFTIIVRQLSVSEGLNLLFKCWDQSLLSVPLA